MSLAVHTYRTGRHKASNYIEYNVNTFVVSTKNPYISSI